MHATRPPDSPADREPAEPRQPMPQYNPPSNWPVPPPGWTPPGTADRLVTAAVAEVLSLLLELDLDPASLAVDGSLVRAPSVQIRLRSRADLVKWAAAEKVQVEYRDVWHQGVRSHHEFSALYHRPGRRMLVQAHIFPHSPEWYSISSQSSVRRI